MVEIRRASDNDIPIILGMLYELGRLKPQIDSDVDVFRKLVKNTLPIQIKLFFLPFLMAQKLLEW